MFIPSPIGATNTHTRASGRHCQVAWCVVRWG